MRRQISILRRRRDNGHLAQVRYSGLVQTPIRAARLARGALGARSENSRVEPARKLIDRACSLPNTAWRFLRTSSRRGCAGRAGSRNAAAPARLRPCGGRFPTRRRAASPAKSPSGAQFPRAARRASLSQASAQIRAISLERRDLCRPPGQPNAPAPCSDRRSRFDQGSRRDRAAFRALALPL